MSKKKREFLSSDLVKIFAKKNGLEDKLFAFQVKDFLRDYLDTSLFSEIKSVNYKNETLILEIHSPLLKNDFRMRKSFYLKKFQETFGADKISDVQIW